VCRLRLFLGAGRSHSEAFWPRRVTDTSDLTGMRALYGHQPGVWQILVPDADGRFPRGGGGQYGEAPGAQPLV
jgi:hypothetical protein